MIPIGTRVLVDSPRVQGVVVGCGVIVSFSAHAPSEHQYLVRLLGNRCWAIEGDLVVEVVPLHASRLTVWRENDATA